MSDTSGFGNTVEVGAELDPGSTSRLQTVIEEAIAKGFEQGMSRISQVLSSNAKLLNNFKKIQQEAFDPKVFSKFVEGLDAVQAANAKYVRGLKESGTATSVIAKSVEQDTARMSKAAIEAREVLLAGERRVTNEQKSLNSQQTIDFQLSQSKQLAELKARLTEQSQASRAAYDTEGRIQKQAAAESIIATSTAAKERVAILRAAISQIEMIEKGIGTTISAVARGAVGVVKGIASAFSGLGSLIHRNNSEFTEGLSSSLKTREVEVRTSFENQSRIIREQTTRQAAAITELKEVTQSGVLGGASKLGLFGGGLLLAGGASLLARSTFKVGSDFIKGMAVVQAQLGLTADQMKVVRQLSIDLGNDLTLPGVSALDASQAIAILSKQFANLGDGAVVAAEQAAKGTLQLSRAVGVGAEDAARVIGAAVNVFGIGADKATDVADQIAGAMTKAAGVSFQNFSDAFVQGASIFDSFVTPAEGATQSLLDFNAALAVLAKNGVIGGQAGAGLKSFFLLGRRETGAAGKAADDLTKRAGAAGTLFFKADGSARTFSDTIDILRKGVEGLTDSQRTNELTTLFGSRGVTAANALISESSKDYADLRDAISKQGLAAKIAAAQNTGFKGALDALQSVGETLQILLYEKVNPALGKATLFIADLANKIFFGNGAWAEFRQVLLGIAIGIGSLLAFEGVVQVIQILTLAVEALLTPMGLLFVAAAAIGGLIQSGVTPFKDLSDAASFVKIELGHLYDVVSAKVAPVLGEVSHFITSTLIPAVESAASWVGQHLVMAFHAAMGFITGTAIPALQSFWSFLTSNAVPAIISFGQTAERWFGIGLEAVKSFWHFVQPFVQPAIDGFGKLGGAIAGIFSGGGLSGLIGGLGSAGAGVGKTFANIGVAIFNALKPVGARIFEFFKDVFSGPHLASLANGFLGFVEAVGRFLGTHLDFIVEWAAKIGGALLYAAGDIALHFVKGFADGLTKSLPNIADGIGIVLKFVFSKALDAALDPKILGLAIAGIFLAAGVISPLINGFKNIGGQAGTSLIGGMRTSLTNAGGFVSTLFGGSGSQAVLGGLQKQAQGLQNDLRILGSTTIVSPSNIKEASTELRNLQGRFTETQIAALTLRDKMSAAFHAVTISISGAGGILSGIGAIGKSFGVAFSEASAGNFGGLGSRFAANFSAGFTQIKLAFTQTIASLREVAASQGQTLGGYLGKGLAIGLGTALAGFMTGKAAGAAGASPILTGLTTGLTAGFATGSPIIGAVAGISSAIGAAFGNADKAADEFKKRVSDLATVIRTNLADALKDGTIKVVDFKTALQSGSGSSDITNQIENNIDPQTVALLKQLGIGGGQTLGAFSHGDISGIISQLTQASKDVFDKTGVLDDTKQYQAAINDLSDAFNLLKGAIAGANDEQTKAAYFQTTAAHSAGLSLTQQILLAQKQPINQTETRPAAATTALLGAPPDVHLTVGAVHQVSNAIDDLNQKLQEYTAQVASAFGADSTLETTIASAQLQIQSLVKDLGSLDLSSISGQAQQTLDLSSVKQQFASVIAAGIQDGSVTGVESAQAALAPLFAAASAEIDAEVAAGTLSPTTADALKAQLLQIINDGITASLPALGNAAAAQAAAAALAAQQAASDASAAALRAIKEGISGAHSIGVQVLAGLTAGLNDPIARKAMTDAALGAAVSIETQLKKHLQIASPSKLTYGIGQNVGHGLAAGVRDSVAGIGSMITGALAIKPPKPAPLSHLDQLLNDHSAWENYISTHQPHMPTPWIPVTTPIHRNLGVQAVNGLTQGLGDQTARTALTGAARSLADSISSALRLHLKIASPSKVTYEIGMFVGQGLAEGLADSSADLSSIISTAISNAIDKGVTAATRAKDAISGALGGMFDALSGSATIQLSLDSPGVTQGITGIIHDLLGGFDSAVSSVLDVAHAAQTGPLTASQADIYGESYNSFNPADVIGSMNIDNITKALDAIQKIGSSLLHAGVDPASVSETMKTFVAEIRNQAVSFGLSADGLDALISSLGLSNVALDAFVQSANEATTAYTSAAALGAATQADTSGDGVANGRAMLGQFVHDHPGDQQGLIDLINTIGRPYFDSVVGLGPDATVEGIAAYILATYGAGTNYAPGAPGGNPIPTTPSTTPDTTTPPADQHTDQLPGASSTIIYVYPPTPDVGAIALGIQNALASQAYVP